MKNVALNEKEKIHLFGKENVSEEVHNILKYSFGCQGHCEDA